MAHLANMSGFTSTSSESFKTHAVEMLLQKDTSNNLDSTAIKETALQSESNEFGVLSEYKRESLLCSTRRRSVDIEDRDGYDSVTKDIVTDSSSTGDFFVMESYRREDFSTGSSFRKDRSRRIQNKKDNSVLDNYFIRDSVPTTHQSSSTTAAPTSSDRKASEIRNNNDEENLFVRAVESAIIGAVSLACFELPLAIVTTAVFESLSEYFE
jgi:hypothetical protein